MWGGGKGAGRDDDERGKEGESAYTYLIRSGTRTPGTRLIVTLKVEVRLEIENFFRDRDRERGFLPPFARATRKRGFSLKSQERDTRTRHKKKVVDIVFCLWFIYRSAGRLELELEFESESNSMLDI